MTRYILAGGADRKFPAYGQDIAKILAGHHRPLRVLSCFFARPREDWEGLFYDWQQFFTLHFGADTIAQMAWPDRFEQQVIESDVIYLHGGDDTLLEYYMSAYKRLDRLFEGKTVIGSSAGAIYLAAYGWTCDWRAVWKGSGLVKARVIVHYGSQYGADDPRGPVDWEAGREALEQYAPDMPLHALREGEFVIVDQP